MGCDIHMYSEAWDANTKKWIALDSEDIIYSGRDYRFFGILAGVRNNSHPQLFEVKGFPSDASEEIKHEYMQWGSDGHTHSYILREEIEEVLDNNTMFESEVYLPKNILKKLLCSIKNGNPEWELLETEYTYDKECETAYIKIPYQYSILSQLEDILGHLPIGGRIIFWFDN